jgi:hypothetical protein
MIMWERGKVEAMMNQKQKKNRNLKPQTHPNV